MNEMKRGMGDFIAGRGGGKSVGISGILSVFRT